jgi:hypothetical protein
MQLYGAVPWLAESRFTNPVEPTCSVRVPGKPTGCNAEAPLLMELLQIQNNYTI